MKYKTRIRLKRIFSVLLVLILTCSITLQTVSALKRSEMNIVIAGSDGEWVRVTAEDAEANGAIAEQAKILGRYEVNTLADTITGAINNTYSNVQNYVESGLTLEHVGEVIDVYATILAYVHFAASNVWLPEGTTDTDEAIGMFSDNAPVGAQIDITAINSMLTQLREAIRSVYPLLTAGQDITWDSKIANGASWPVLWEAASPSINPTLSMDYATSDIIVDTNSYGSHDYLDRVQAIFKIYIQGSMMATLADNISGAPDGYKNAQSLEELTSYFDINSTFFAKSDASSITANTSGTTDPGAIGLNPTDGSHTIYDTPIGPTLPADPTDPSTPADPATPADPLTPTSVTGNEAAQAASVLWDACSKELVGLATVGAHINKLISDLESTGLSDYESSGVKYYAYVKVYTDADAIPGTDNIIPLFRQIWENHMSPNNQVNAVGDGLGAEGSTVITVDSGALGLLTNGAFVNGVPTFQGEPTLSNLGFPVIAAGAIYDPFVSKAGNESYLSIIDQFIQTDNDKENVRKILQAALNTKKPIYVTEGSKNAWSEAAELTSIDSASYRIAYLQDLLEIDQSSLRAYCVIRGSMEPSAVDSSTFEYVNSGLAPVTSSENGNTSTEASGTGTTDAVTVETSAGNNSANGSVAAGAASAGTQINGTVTTGGSQLVASSYQMSVPLLITAGRELKLGSKAQQGYAASVGGMTSLIIHNAAIDAKDNTHISSATKELLFLNGLGDIVLSDGTVILPAIANPVFYNYDDQYANASVHNDITDMDSHAISETYMNNFMANQNEICYYPYNAAFMNHYPAARINEEGRLELDSDSDVNKYLMYINAYGVAFAKRISDINGKDIAKIQRNTNILVAPISNNSLSVTDNTTSTVAGLYIGFGRGDSNLGSKVSSFFQNGSRGLLNGFSGQDTNDHAYIARNRVYNGDGISFFPICDTDVDIRDTFIATAGPIVTSALRFICSAETNTGVRIDSGKFKTAIFAEHAVAEGLLGTQYAESLVKNYQVSYDELVEDQLGRFTKFFIQITNSLANSLGNIDGVLSIKGPFENPFFNTVYNFIQDFYLVVLVILMVVVASRFFKGHYNILYVAFIGLCCVAGFEVYANWLPTLIPQVYNFAVNDAIEDVVWKSVLYNAEQYEDVYSSNANRDASSGNLTPYTSTITLYNLTNKEMREVAAYLGIDLKEVRNGTPIYLDQDAGIFVQGNLIKMSVDSLLVSNTMRGLYRSQWLELAENEGVSGTALSVPNSYNANPYSIELTGPLVSLEAYYTPYDYIERSFMGQLNTFSSYFRVQRNMYSYADGKLYKDAFLVKAFIYSGIFTAPGDEEILKQNVSESTITEVRNDYTNPFTSAEVDDLIQAVNEAFFPWDDWLGLVAIFEQPDRGIQNSLWGYMMQRRGWYTEDWRLTEGGAYKLSDMIRYINNHTKNWVIENRDELAYVSDENAIKMISLYATTCFTQYFSQITEWVFPNYVDAATLSLQDVLYSAMTSLRDRNFAYDGTAVNTVALNLGIAGVIFIMFIIIFATLFIFVITYLVPILYSLLGGVIIFKLINNENGMGLIKGYTKVTLVSTILYFIFSLSLKLVAIGGYAWYAYLGCLVVMFLCDYFLFWVCLSIATDVGELGNNTLSNNLLRGLDKLTMGKLSKMTANHVNLDGRRRVNIMPRVAYQYNRTSNVDNYERPRGRRYSPYPDEPDLSAPTHYGSHFNYGGYGRRDRYTDRSYNRIRTRAEEQAQRERRIRNGFRGYWGR